MLAISNHGSLISSGINKVCLCLCSAEQNGLSSCEGKELTPCDSLPGKELTPCDSVRDLGVYVDSQLS